MIEVEEQPDDLGDIDFDLDEEADDTPRISAHALTGAVTEGYETMRVTVFVGKRHLHILIDSGSTHNFLDTNVAKKLGCKITQVKPMKVDVANGNSLACVAACKNLPWTLQGSVFVTDVLLLPLGSCDMVLGVQWLETLGDINWNFKELRMEFVVNGKKFMLRGGKMAKKFKTLVSYVALPGR
ncbi:Retroviral aspartyl protease [Corchorus olitorius]|uniref:Retroviral aspartyl protease n=1 Tax=Corchorus olitorius TaxID=93759 RepID=A0A1R3KGV0_9ROSI|nr:Retroviral aspartyl protease [Corchorus olitorius]